MLCDPLTPVVMAISGMKRSFISNTSCFSNLYLIECFRKCKSKGLFEYRLLLKTENTVTKIIFKCVNSVVGPNFKEKFAEIPT